ncbi:MAG: hypothetical protein ACFE9L_16690 [Candidatus Hodarchaeota archaeon]
MTGNQHGEEIVLKTFLTFSDYLRFRFKENRRTTEDSIRYTLFHSFITKLDLNPTDFEFEVDHPKFSGKKLDTVIASNQITNGMVFEFKYDHSIPSEASINTTNRAGAIFADIFRIAQYLAVNNDQQGYFVYLTDEIMKNYFQNSAQLRSFFNLSQGKTLPLNAKDILSYRKSFVTKLEDYPIDCIITNRVSEEITPTTVLKIYQVTL